MLGYDAMAFRRLTGEREDLVAKWHAGPVGLRWLKQLEQSGHAIALTGNGYPTTFVIAAGVLLPILTKGLPEESGPVVIQEVDTLPEHWNNDIVWNRDNALACTADELLHVEAWLHHQVGPALDALKADPSRAVTPDAVRARLAAERRK